MGEDGVTGDGSFEGFELIHQSRGPDDRRDGLAQVGTGQGAEFMDFLFKMRNEATVESGEAAKRTKRVAGARKFPITNKVKFGLCGGITVGVNVVAHPFEAVEEEVAFLEVEGQAVFDVDFAETAEPTED